MIEYKKVKNYSAYIFDFDGVLYQTRAANKAAYQKSFDHLNIKINPSLFDKLNGLCFKQFIQQSEVDITDEQFNMVKKQKALNYPLFFKYIKRNGALFSLIDELKNNNKLVGIASSASYLNIKNVLDHFKDFHFFDFVLAREHVIKPKPDPEIYEKCLSSLGVHANQCLVFEDSDIGQAAAKSAGLFTIRVDL